MRILLAEDDRMIGEGVRTSLRQDGYAVNWVRDGHAALLLRPGAILVRNLLDNAIRHTPDGN